MYCSFTKANTQVSTSIKSFTKSGFRHCKGFICLLIYKMLFLPKTVYALKRLKMNVNPVSEDIKSILRIGTTLPFAYPAQ